MLLPTSCPACGTVGPAPCADCRMALLPAPALPPPTGLASCVALMAYEGVGREIVARLKYANARSSVPWLGVGMAAAVRRLAPGLDVVTWVPTTAQRRHRRGFDQGRILATEVARHLGLPGRPLLVRLPGPSQTGRSRAERLGGPRLVARRTGVAGRVLLVDDVVTTGATLTIAAGVLRDKGAGEVHAVVVARRGLH
ncbi:MAG: phosphoribosyltransferase family protein [Acidimicrobiales bacterium]